MTVLEKVAAWWSALRAGKRLEVQWDDAGVVVSVMPPNDEPPLHLKWDEITSVYAYKRDCVSVDQIRLVLGDEAGQKWIEVSEDDIGGKQLFVELPRYIPDFPALYDWWDRVAQPAFAPQWTQIYRRAEPTR